MNVIFNRSQYYTEELFNFDVSKGFIFNNIDLNKVRSWILSKMRVHFSDIVHLTRDWNMELDEYNNSLVLSMSFCNLYPIGSNVGTIEYEFYMVIGGILEGVKYGDIDIDFFIDNPKTDGDFLEYVDSDDDFYEDCIFNYDDYNRSIINFDDPNVWNGISNSIKLLV